ncbi:MAG: hypothetical protein ACF8PN_17350 [Phycisphaerales bacterium]
MIRLLTRLSSIPLVALTLGLTLAVGAWWGIRSQRGEAIAELERSLEESRRQVETLEAMVERLSGARRLAQIIVTRQESTPEAGVETELLMVELAPDGRPLSKQRFVIPGTVGFFDGLVIKFDPESVAVADPLRGQSLVLLRRVYSETMAPEEGIPVDSPAAVPPAYRTQNEPGEFERRLWERFWELANDPRLAEELGVRVAQGEAVYKPLRPGVLYELSIDAIGGMNLETRPLPEAVSDALLKSGAKLP